MVVTVVSPGLNVGSQSLHAYSYFKKDFDLSARSGLPSAEKQLEST